MKTIEVSRTLGHTVPRSFLLVALPLARPAIAAGAALVAMETLADYGTVFYFGVNTFTTGIFKVFYGLDDSIAALQLSATLLGVIALLLTCERLARRHRVEVIPGVSSPMACAAALGLPLAARNDVLAVIPAPLDDQRLTAQLANCDAAAVVKVGRHLEKVRRVLDALGLLQRAHYVERASMVAQRIMPLAEAEPPAPYFSMIIVHKRGTAWR